MCGRYQFSEADLQGMVEIMEMLNRKFGYDTAKKGEVYPTNLAPVLTLNPSGELDPMICRWGFPKWDNKGVIINAKAETVFEKKMFRNSIMARRCAVISTGFFEWQKANPDKPKDKYLLRSPDETVLFMAGFYNTFKDAAGAEYPAFVILTTAASDTVGKIHDRMPVILQQDELARWISDSDFTATVLSRPGTELTLQAA